jgi:hypothetical protein
MNNRNKIKDYVVYDYDVDKDKLSKYEWENNESKRKYITNLATEIGWIVIEFSSLENKLDSTLNFHLIENNKNKEIIFSMISRKSYSEKVDLLNNMFKINYARNPEIYDIHFEDFLKDLKEVYENLKKVGQIRNNYAHSIFSNVNETKFVERKTKLTAQGIQKEFIKYDYKDIETDFQKIYDVGDKLSSFNEKTWEFLLD